MFVEGYGGGVCQVSTTLYNACLLAGLEVLEVHNHSLPVSYVESSFDAMVNIGSSDLKIKNNSGGKIIITTSFENDVCKVKIFGKPNKYKIKRISEKIKEIEAPPDMIETDVFKYPDHKLEVGEERRISYSKKGLVSKGVLEYYDNSGRFVKSEIIRKDTYAPTKGIILKREK
jgi:vancomycin resistance protein YoaR